MKARYEVTKPGSSEGFAMAATLGVLTLLSILVITVFANAMASFASGQKDVDKSRTYYAAEAAAESGMAQLAVSLQDAVLEDDELSSITPPDIPGFTFPNFSVVRIGGITDEIITDGPFAGLYSKTQVVDITAEAVSPDNTSSAIMVTAKAQAIPIFQFGVFYEKDLEIANGPRMDFDGWVHSNGNIYLSSNTQYFGDVITTPNSLYHDRKDRHSNNSGTYISDATANYEQLTFDSRDTPDANAFRTASDEDFDNRVQTSAYGVDSLTVPLPEGVDALTIIQPRATSDGLLEHNSKFAWKADWYIEVDLGDIAALNGKGKSKGKGKGKGNNEGSICDDGITHTRATGVKSPKANECENIFFFGTDMFYEGRELRYVDMVDIDVGELQNWASGKGSGKGAGKGDPTSIIYITIDTVDADDPEGDGVYPVIRLINAATLTDPITISTRHPLYVAGDFNTGTSWYPAAIIGDAITFLSTVWDDAEHQAATVIKPDGANTTVYTALLAGHSGTPCDHEASGCGSTSPYGGGFENFPRFLERWTGETLTFRGSLVSLYYAQQATGLWGGGYYSPPVRDWEYDSRFSLPENMPPGTPVVGNVIHTAFRPIH